MMHLLTLRRGPIGNHAFSSPVLGTLAECLKQAIRADCDYIIEVVGGSPVVPYWRY